jgi:hypothetical protein
MNICSCASFGCLCVIPFVEHFYSTFSSSSYTQKKEFGRGSFNSVSGSKLGRPKLGMSHKHFRLWAVLDLSSTLILCVHILAHVHPQQRPISAPDIKKKLTQKCEDSEIKI